MTTTRQTVTLYLDTLESVEVPIGTDADPTATPPAFGVTAAGSSAGPTTWVNGSWVGAYNTTTDETQARTPTFGKTGSGASIILAVGRYDLWVRLSLGGELPVWVASSIRVP